MKDKKRGGFTYIQSSPVQFYEVFSEKQFAYKVIFCIFAKGKNIKHEESSNI